MAYIGNSTLIKMIFIVYRDVADREYRTKWLCPPADSETITAIALQEFSFCFWEKEEWQESVGSGWG